MSLYRYGRQLLTFGPAQQDQIPAFRIAVSVAIPLLILLASNQLDLAIYATFGSFTALYARHEPRRARCSHQLQAGAILFICISLGLTLNWYQASEPVILAACALVSGLGAVASTVLGLKPPGSIFYIFATGAIASIPTYPNPLVPLAVALASITLSVLLGLAGSLWGEGVRVTVIPQPHGLTSGQLLEQGLIYLAVTLVSGILGYASGLSHSYWAMVAASAVMIAPAASARIYRGIHRTLGTLGGVLITAFIVSMNPSPWHTVVFVILFQFLAEVYVRRNYGFAVLFITPLALLMIQLAHPMSSYELLTDRLVETAIGAAVGMFAVLITRSPDKLGQDTVAIPIVRAARTVRQQSKVHNYFT